MRVVRSGRDWLALLAAVLVPLAVCAVLVPFRASLAPTNAALVLVVVVVAIASTGRRLAGVVAAVSAGLWFDLLLTEPYGRLTITHRTDLETFLLLVVVGVAVSELAARGRRHREVARTDEAYLDEIQAIVELVSSGAEPREVTREVGRRLKPLLGLTACRYEQGVFVGNPHRLRSDGSVMVDGEPWPVEERGMPSGDIELLVRNGRHLEGRFLMTPEPGLVVPVGARRVAVILAELIHSPVWTSVGR